MNISQLPKDLFLNLFFWLDPNSYQQATKVCQRWRQILINRAEWQCVLDRAIYMEQNARNIAIIYISAFGPKQEIQNALTDFVDDILDEDKRLFSARTTISLLGVPTLEIKSVRVRDPSASFAQDRCKEVGQKIILNQSTKKSLLITENSSQDSISTKYGLECRSRCTLTRLSELVSPQELEFYGKYLRLID